MKFQINKLFLIFSISLLFMILINITIGTCSYIPYSSENIFTKQYPYNAEGFKEEMEDEEEDKKKILTIPEGYKEGNVDEMDNADEIDNADNSDKMDKMDEMNKKNKPKKDMSNNIIPTKITKNDIKENFQGLKSGSFLNEEYKGYLVNNDVSPSCGKSSNGLSTSRGYVCLSPVDINYLKTRGGNATSKGEF